MEEIRVNEEVLGRLEGEELAIAVVTTTKPDFYKQWSILPAAEKLGVPAIVINTGQHYDGLLGYGLKEFSIEKSIAFDLGVRGDLLQKAYEMLAKAGGVAKYLRTRFPKTQFVPVVHGDTIGAGIFPIGWMFGSGKKVAQNEAGLRGMSPPFSTDPEKYIELQREGEWKLARQEPFPEQWDTFVAGASSELHFAPTELNRQHLLREGYPGDRIFVVGNSVVDAMEYAKKNPPEVSIFEEYPRLDRYDSWIRVDIHRRANLIESRFKVIVEGIERLVRRGQPVVWVELPGTKFAVERYGLRGKLDTLAENHENFLYTPLWRDYSQVMEFLRSGNCIAELTDSGSMQEELNQLGLPCFTVRYNTDRPETVFEGRSNLLVPPHRKLFTGLLEHLLSRDELLDEMSHGKKLYGRDVGVKIVQKIKKLHDEGLSMMRTVAEVEGLKKGEEINFL